jgi:hypothetical protein
MLAAQAALRRGDDSRNSHKRWKALAVFEKNRSRSEGDRCPSMRLIAATSEPSLMRSPATGKLVATKSDLRPEKWTVGYADFASACCGVM